MKRTPAERRMTFTVAGPTVRTQLAPPVHGTHDAVVSLQQRVGFELMSRPLGTSLCVTSIFQHYFLVPQEDAGPDGFSNDTAIDLMCAPFDTAGIAFDDTLSAWMSPYVGHDRMETIELALRLALSKGDYVSFDLGAARRALAADARVPLPASRVQLRATLACAA